MACGTHGIVILNRGHGNKGSHSQFDPGATFGELREVDLVAGYFDAIEQHLSTGGIAVHRLDTGSYANRHNRAGQIARTTRGRVLHILGHVNSAGRPGRYGAVFHDHRSSNGAIAARLIADQMRPIRELTTIKLVSTTRTGNWRRAYNVLSPVYSAPANCSGVLLEPGFINSPTHQPLWTGEGLMRLGNAIARGILPYFS